MPTTDQESPPAEREQSHRHRRGFIRGLRHWWQESTLENARWRLWNWFFNWWFPTSREAESTEGGYGGYYTNSRRSRLGRAWRHLRAKLRHSKFSRWFVLALDGVYNWFFPRRDHTEYAGYYGRTRHNRLAQGLRRLKRWAQGSMVGRGVALLAQRFTAWWYPSASDSESYSGYHRRQRKNRLSLSWFAVKRWLRHSWVGQKYSAFNYRFYDWWYPVTSETGAYSGYYGRKRRSRLNLVGQWLRRKARHSWVGRQYLQVSSAFFNWWYPVSEQSEHSYSGYYGPRRRSRPELVWHSVKKFARHSWVGRQYALYANRLFEWWYPAVASSYSHYPHYQTRRVSRPVLAYRRWNRWFRKTWVGREFGWLLDEFFDLVFFVQIQLTRDLAWKRMERSLARPRTLLALGLLGVGLILANKIGRPQYYGFMERSYARQADQLLQKGDYLRAHLRARQALNINQENSLAVRVEADIADWANDSFAVYWRRRAALLAPSFANRIALANTALNAEQFPYTITSRALEEVDPQSRQSSAYHMAAGALSLKLGRLQEAEAHYSEATKLQPEDPMVRMSLAVVQLQSRNPRIVADSRVTLELLNARGKLGILPLRSLVAESVGRQEFDRAEQYSDQVLTNSEAAFGDYMLHLAILRAGGRSQFQSFLKKTQEKSLQQPAYLGELVAWMGQHGMAREALTWTTNLPPQINSQGLVPLAMADCFAALKLWPELENFLTGAHWRGMDHVRIALLTYAIRNQTSGARTRYTDAWQRAVGLATDAPSALNMLAHIAWQWGWKDETEQVLWHAAGKFPTQAWPIESLKNFYASQRQTTGLLRLFEDQVKRDADDNLAKNNFAMVSLLLRRNMPTAHDYAAKLYQSQPTNSAFASTYALSLHLQGKSQEGVKVLKTLKPQELAEPGLAAYYGILLAATGEKAAAKEWLDKSGGAFLLPEEVALVEAARKTL